VHRSLPVELPTSSTAAIDKSEQLSVTVRSDGDVFINKERVPLEDLERVLVERTARAADAGVLLFGDRDVSYQRLFMVLDRIQKAGISKVSLQAEMEPPAP
jgi:biopolymer transport protein ExbD